MRAPILVALAAVLTATGARAAEPSLDQLTWLAGCWASENAEAGSVEHWLPLAGGTMLGVSRTVRNGRTVEHEFMQIRRDAEGRVVYIALPSRQTEASFTAVSVGDRSVTFENPAHDFPQRILYKAVGEDRLAARIEGQRNGATRGIDFPMRRVSCDTALRP
ncbi:DUF6265 family protein [Roseateles chitosanitabidus]|jgi:hypothetical protein|uniref:DUF6265 family protein n=1 Tax=Roseateles chitosanitabidus TaxID=65048 RepID=UPI00082DAE64|nr:DUF6265 family protein [Roseateles chitosanitabidus]MBO9687214.1 hypothetical protein [Roseateles chitosanitabidus]